MSLPITPRRRRARVLVGALAGVALAVGAPLAASAHIHVTPDASSAETATTLTFSFSHGCEDSPTTSLIVDIPDGVTNVVPVASAEWSIDRATSETGAVTQVVYTAVAPIENGIKGEVSMDARFSAELADSTVAFPVTQQCATGSTAWTEIAAEGEEEPESPAPVVAVGAVAEEDAHGHGGGAADTAHDNAAHSATAESSPAGTVAVWLGAGGLTLGAAALVVAVSALRRRRT